MFKQGFESNSKCPCQSTTEFLKQKYSQALRPTEDLMFVALVLSSSLLSQTGMAETELCC